MYSVELVDRLVAHRGANNEVPGNQLPRFPENTLPAMQEAYRQGVRFVECDIQTTKDGRIIVLHDDTLRRTARYNKVLAKDFSQDEFYAILDQDVELLSYEKELIQIDVGNSTITAKIPLLEEFFDELCLDEKRVLLVEMKRGDIKLVRSLQKMITSYPQLQQHQLIFISFNYDLLTLSKEAIPQFEHVFLLTYTPDQQDVYLDPDCPGKFCGLYHRTTDFKQLDKVISMAKASCFDGISFEYNRSLNKNWIQTVKEQGFWVYVWNYVHDDYFSAITHALEIGADLVATNQPEQILKESH